MPGKVVTLVGYDILQRELYRVWDDTSEIGSLLADTPIPSTNAQDNDDADHTLLLVPTHENTNTPDSSTHDTEQPQHSESEQQDELSLEQSMQDDSYKQVSIGPTPNSDFTAPDADYTDPNQYVEGKPPSKGLTWEQSDSPPMNELTPNFAIAWRSDSPFNV
eukprot:g44349.t1